MLTSWPLPTSAPTTGPEAAGGWYFKAYAVEDAGILVTDQFRIRFVAQDLFNGSIVEAGVDAVELHEGFCIVVKGCPWDCDGSNDEAVGVDDFLATLAQWGQIGSPCDFDVGAPGVGVDEFLDVLENWGRCPITSNSPTLSPLSHGAR